MKVPSKRSFENIIESHTQTKLAVKVKRDAASLMFLRYLLFMKKLAIEADNMAFRHRRTAMKAADIVEAEKIVGNISETAKIISRKRAKQSAMPSSSLQSGGLDSSNFPDKENEHPDTSESEESE